MSAGEHIVHHCLSCAVSAATRSKHVGTVCRMSLNEWRVIRLLKVLAASDDWKEHAAADWQAVTGMNTLIESQSTQCADVQCRQIV